MSILIMGKSLVTVSLCGLVALALALRAVVRAHRGGPEGPALARSSMDASLFWGAAAFAVGLLHTVLGLIVTLLSIRAAAPAGPRRAGAHRHRARRGAGRRGLRAARLRAGGLPLVRLPALAAAWPRPRHVVG